MKRQFKTVMINNFTRNNKKRHRVEEGTRHFNPLGLEVYRFFHHWFSGVKMP
jgi:hypothetical protein